MNDVHAIEVLNDMVRDGALDGNVVTLLIDNFQMLNDLRESSQQEAAKHYRNFMIQDNN
jgi:hypothetical protein